MLSGFTRFRFGWHGENSIAGFQTAGNASQFFHMTLAIAEKNQWTAPMGNYIRMQEHESERVLLDSLARGSVRRRMLRPLSSGIAAHSAKENARKFLIYVTRTSSRCFMTPLGFIGCGGKQAEKFENIGNAKKNERAVASIQRGNGCRSIDKKFVNATMKKLFALCLLAVALVVNSIELPVVPPGTSITISARRFGAELEENAKFNCSAMLVDEAYIAPSEVLLPKLLSFCEKNRTKVYRTNTFDCDDIAQEYKLLAQKWVLETYPGVSASLAIGVAFVHIDGQVEGLYPDYSDSLHAVVVLRLADGRWIAIEPSTGKWIFVDSAIYEGTLEFKILLF